LIETLHRTERRLADLTAGEVDTVADGEGRTLLLRRSQEHLRYTEAAKQAAILDALPAHIAVLDAQGVILSVNETWRRFASANAMQEQGQGVGLNYLEVCDRTVGQDAPGARAVASGIRSVLDGGSRTFSMEYPCHSPTEQRWFLSTVTPLSEDRRNGAIVMHVDVTRERNAEETLRASELRFRQIAENIREVFWLTDPAKNQILYISPAYEEIWGRSCESVYASPLDWLDAIHADDRDRVIRSFPTQASGKYAEEYRIVRPDGSIRWIRDRAFPVAGNKGEVYRIAGLAADITESKLAADELYESQRRFSDLLGNVEMVSLMLDTNARITYCNDYLLRLTDRRREDVIGGDWFGLFVPPGRQDVRDVFGAVLADLPSASHHENEILTRLGFTKLIQWNNTVLRSAAGEVVGLASIGMDITEHRQMEEQLRHVQKMEAVGQLAAGVAHEFNNLLQAMMSMAAIVRLRALNPEVARIGTEMESQIRRGAGLTQQLLLFSRREAIVWSDLDLREEVEKAGVLLGRLIPENIRIVVESARQRLAIQGDSGQIQQVLLNLAINARDAMSGGGTMTIRAGAGGGEVFLEVEDTGHGMDEGTRARIFEPFFTTKELGKGTGLGLAVVYGIVERHGGRIDVRSEPGRRSCFRIVFPEGSVAGARSPELSDAAEVFAGSGRVLLVEDEQAVREGIALLLKIIGYEVIAAASGEEAMALPPEPVPDVLLSDVTLPGMTGSALGERLHERWPSLKVVLMSGYMEEASRANAGEQGWHFLQKPFEMADLARNLSEALEGFV
jgi:PAS domain S-box-containing protein